jgi:hypothetical protein
MRYALDKGQAIRSNTKTMSIGVQFKLKSRGTKTNWLTVNRQSCSNSDGCHGLNSREVVTRAPQEQEIFLFFITSRLTLGAHPASYRKGTGGISSGRKASRA